MPSKTDECVESVLEDDPSLSESAAWAICKAQKQGFDIDEIEVQSLSNVAGMLTMSQQAVPDNAVNISDRSEAPEDAEIVEGDRGGLYYIPPNKDNGGDEEKSTIDPSEITGRDDIEPQENSNGEMVSDEQINDNILSAVEGIDEFATVEDVVGGRGASQNLAEVEFLVGDEDDVNARSALGVNAIENTYDEGITRFPTIELPDNIDKSIATEDMTEIVQAIGRPDDDTSVDQLDIDMGHWDDATPHIRINEPVDADELESFLQDFDDAVNEWFYPYDNTDEPPQDAEEMQRFF